jgi:hypothetical protein
MTREQDHQRRRVAVAGSEGRRAAQPDQAARATGADGPTVGRRGHGVPETDGVDGPAVVRAPGLAASVDREPDRKASTATLTWRCEPGRASASRMHRRSAARGLGCRRNVAGASAHTELFALEALEPVSDDRAGRSGWSLRPSAWEPLDSLSSRAGGLPGPGDSDRAAADAEGRGQDGVEALEEAWSPVGGPRDGAAHASGTGPGGPVTIRQARGGVRLYELPRRAPMGDGAEPGASDRGLWPDGGARGGRRTAQPAVMGGKPPRLRQGAPMPDGRARWDRAAGAHSGAPGAVALVRGGCGELDDGSPPVGRMPERVPSGGAARPGRHPDGSQGLRGLPAAPARMGEPVAGGGMAPTEPEWPRAAEAEARAGGRSAPPTEHDEETHRSPDASGWAPARDRPERSTVQRSASQGPDLRWGVAAAEAGVMHGIAGDGSAQPERSARRESAAGGRCTPVAIRAEVDEDRRPPGPAVRAASAVWGGVGEAAAVLVANGGVGSPRTGVSVGSPGVARRVVRAVESGHPCVAGTPRLDASAEPEGLARAEAQARTRQVDGPAGPPGAGAGGPEAVAAPRPASGGARLAPRREEPSVDARQAPPMPSAPQVERRGACRRRHGEGVRRRPVVEAERRRRRAPEVVGARRPRAKTSAGPSIRGAGQARAACGPSRGGRWRPTLSLHAERGRSGPIGGWWGASSPGVPPRAPLGAGPPGDRPRGGRVVGAARSSRGATERASQRVSWDPAGSRRRRLSGGANTRGQGPPDLGRRRRAVRGRVRPPGGPGPGGGRGAREGPVTG